MKPLFRLSMALSAALLACEPSDGGTVLGPDATGVVTGTIYADRNGSGVFEPQFDLPASGVRVRLILGAGTVSSQTLVSDSAGVLPPTVLPVGSYRVVVDAAALGDTIQVADNDSARITLAANDTAQVVVQLRYPMITAIEVRTAPIGRRVLVDGIVLNTWAAFGDSTVHMADRSGALRLARTPVFAFAIGDSIRVLGTVQDGGGRAVLRPEQVFRLGASVVPAAHTVSTAQAAIAASGALDAALVHVRGTIVRDATTITGGDSRVSIDDGSGVLDVILDRDAGINLPLPLQNGGDLEARGILVPVPGGPSWWLKPRASADVQIRYPTMHTRQVRALDPGRFVSIRGTALNDWTGFGDASLHVSDSTGVIRILRVARNSVLIGDLVEVLGTVGISDGNPVLLDATATVAGTGDLPAPVQLRTGEAADARGGQLDAALVGVSATIHDTVTIAGLYRVGVDDGSGRLEVLIATASGIDIRQLIPDQVVTITGLLTPQPGGRVWRLRPRQRGDVVIR